MLRDYEGTGIRVTRVLRVTSFWDDKRVGRVSGEGGGGKTGGSAEVSLGSAAASMWPRLHYHLQLASSS